MSPSWYVFNINDKKYNEKFFDFFSYGHIAFGQFTLIFLILLFPNISSFLLYISSLLIFGGWEILENKILPIEMRWKKMRDSIKNIASDFIFDFIGFFISLLIPITYSFIIGITLTSYVLYKRYFTEMGTMK